MLLQRTVLSIFADFDAWMIAIFDNFLLGADNFPDLLARLKIFFIRCKERNIILKMTKAYSVLERLHSSVTTLKTTSFHSANHANKRFKS